MIPHPTKVKKGGEDAQFATEKILVVADGVGGWADVFIYNILLVWHRSWTVLKRIMPPYRKHIHKRSITFYY